MKPNPIVGGGTSEEAWRTSRPLAELATISAAELVPVGKRAVIIAPHPDDEVLSCGGLLQQLAELGRALLIISVTDGDASHPGSQRWPAPRLIQIRPLESSEALQRLRLPVDNLQWLRGGFADSGVAGEEARLQAFLQEHLRADDVVFCTWREDGHSDHEAVGRASQAATHACGARLIELPVWTWHWASPEDSRVPWDRARKLLLTPAMLARKQHAVQAFTSQLEGDPAIGLGPVLAPYVLERLLRPFEVVFL
jgi:LmbE family N-acetylglucosaminyl deacetylase